MKISNSIVIILAAIAPNLTAAQLRGGGSMSGTLDGSMQVQEPFDPRIVGGTVARQYPFFVQGSGCGASLVAPDVVLTAAHCLNSFQSISSVIVGNTEYGQVTSGAQRRNIVGNMILHPQWDRNTFQYDLMMFKIERVTTPSQLAPIALNQNTFFPGNGQVLTAIGFGATSEGGSGSRTLLQVNVPTISFEQCAPRVSGHPLHDNSMICAGGERGFDACQGDSGGPLIDPETGVLVGVTSWGDGCGRAGVPGVYSKVSTSLQWIEDTICALTDTMPWFCQVHPIHPFDLIN